jgi:hypothetical protein
VPGDDGLRDNHAKPTDKREPQGFLHARPHPLDSRRVRRQPPDYEDAD